MTFADWWKVNDVKEDQEEKNDSNITDLSCQAAHDVINRKNVFLYGMQGLHATYARNAIPLLINVKEMGRFIFTSRLLHNFE